MNRWTDPRLQVYAPARVARIEEPETEMDAEVLDVSPAGMRLVTAEELQEDQIITIETDRHLILADVRSCVARGAKFGIGAGRVHSAAILSLPQTVTKGERNRALIADFHRRLQDELSAVPDPVASRPDGAAARFEARHLNLGALSGTASTATAAPPVRIPPRAPELVTLPEIALPSESVATPLPAVVLVEPPPAGAYFSKLTPAEPPEIKIEPQHLPFLATPVTAPSNDSPQSTAIDPIRAAAQRWANFKPARKKRSRSRAMAILLAASLSLVALGTMLFGRFANWAPVLQIAAAGEHAVKIPTLAVNAAAPQPVPVSTPVSRAAPVTGTSHASILASDQSWVTACADGNTLFSQLFAPGAQQEIEFSSRAVVRTGSAGPLEILLDGKTLGPLGRGGQVRVIELTPGASRFLTPGEPGDCTVTR